MPRGNPETIARPGASVGESTETTPLFRRIVIGFERDEAARRAVQVGTIFANELGSELIIAASIAAPMGTPPTALHPDIYDEVSADVRQRLLQEVQAITGSHARTVRLYISFASPGDHILSTSEQVDADLILVGSHGRHGIGKLILGSTSESLAVSSTRPVMVIGPECKVSNVNLQTILFASNLEHTGRSAGLFAADLARRTNGRVVAMHTEREKSSAIHNERERNEARIREHLENSLRRDEQPHTLPVEFRISYGDAADEILATAKDTRAGMIVVGDGTHRIIGDHVPWRTLTPLLRNAPCPVIIVGRDCN